jgi:peptidyl-tRNA hydrolase
MLHVFSVRRTALTIIGVAILLTVGALAVAGPPTPRINAAAKKVAGRKSSTNTKAVRDESSAKPIDGSSFHLLIVRDPVIQRELHLTTEQIGRVEEALAEIDQPLFSLRDAKEPEMREKAALLLTKLAAALTEILDAPQRQRLWEIVVQARGAAGLRSPTVAAELELSPNQVRRIEQVFSDIKRASEALTKKAAHGEKVQQEKPADIQTAGQKKILAVLSSQQKERFSALAGDRFDLTRLRPLAYKAPGLQEIDRWINSEPLSLEQLRGKVVALNFFAYG